MSSSKGRVAVRQLPSRHAGLMHQDDRGVEMRHDSHPDDLHACPPSEENSSASSRSSNSLRPGACAAKRSSVFTYIESALETWYRWKRVRVVCSTLLLVGSITVIVTAVAMATHHRKDPIWNDGRLEDITSPTNSGGSSGARFNGEPGGAGLALGATTVNTSSLDDNTTQILELNASNMRHRSPAASAPPPANGSSKSAKPKAEGVLPGPDWQLPAF